LLSIKTCVSASKERSRGGRNGFYGRNKGKRLTFFYKSGMKKVAFLQFFNEQKKKYPESYAESKDYLISIGPAAFCIWLQKTSL